MKTIISVFFILGLVVSNASAQEIANVKGNRAIVNSIAPGTEVGDKFIARDGNGKAKALVEVKQVKNDKAIVQALKGKLAKGHTLTPYKGRTASKSSAGSATRTASKSSWGILLGYSQDSMTIKSSGSQSASLSGSSLDLSAFYHRNIDGAFGARVLAGYETLEASGTGNVNCEGSTNCGVKIGYLGLQGLLTYSYVQSSSLDLWVGAGLGFLYAFEKESNAIDTGKLSTNQTILVSLGMDYRASSTFFIPLQIEYALYPDTNTTTASQINIRIGAGFDF